MTSPGCRLARRDISTIGMLRRAQAIEQLVAVGMRVAFGRIGLALRDQVFDARMVARARRGSGRCASSTGANRRNGPRQALLCWIRQATMVVRGVSGRRLTAR